MSELRRRRIPAAKDVWIYSGQPKLEVAMKSLEPILSLLSEIEDPRRAEGKMYKLPHVLLFTILAIVSGANSYRSVHTFMKMHRVRLNKAFGIRWKNAPVHSAIRYILQGLKTDDVEKAFRRHAADLDQASGRTLALDGKALRQSFDAFHDVRARQVLSAFAPDTALVLAHAEIDEKSNEIPAVQQLLKDLGIKDHIVTLDALHCQKKPSRRQRHLVFI
jgi:hypothetical protein